MIAHTKHSKLPISPLLCVFLLWTTSHSATSAELSGKFWGHGNQHFAPKSCIIHIACASQKPVESTLNGDGTYSVRGLPPNTTCSLTLKQNNIQSRPLTVRTNATSVRFNGEVRSGNKSLIVLPRQ